MGGQWHTKNNRTSKRGAFLAGVWHCDCDPRLPADKFQTKNGGKNHGRWFYTCQQPQPKRCGFFLWTDDAKIREEAAVLNNSRSEPAQPQTPRKPVSAAQIPTPETRPRAPLSAGKVEQRPSLDREDSFAISSSDEALFLTVAEDFETPSRKAARTETFTSPSKRKLSYTETQSLYPEIKTSPTIPISSVGDDDVFATPSTSTKSTTNDSGLLSPQPTPTHFHPPASQAAQAPPAEHSSLASAALEILKPAITIPRSIEEQLVDLLNRHDLRTQGILRGRDITRVAVETKERRIAELQTRITGLETEREMMKGVVGHLKQDIAISKTPRKKKDVGEDAGNGTRRDTLGERKKSEV